MNKLCIVLVITVFILIIMIIMAEEDRRFQCVEPLNTYYLMYPARSLLGIFNTLIRWTHDCSPRPCLEEHFPEHKEFFDNRAAIRNEALHVFNTLQLPSFNQVDSAFDPIADNRWKTFIILWYGNMLENRRYAPITAALVEKHRNVIGCAMFSILQPGVRIPPHKGPCAAALRYHLCLQVPKNGTAKIKVAKEWITYADGGEYLFDDTYTHEVIVDAPADDDVRIVLFMDIIRKMRQPMKYFADTIAKNATFADFVKKVNANGEVKEKI